MTDDASDPAARPPDSRAGASGAPRPVGRDSRLRIVVLGYVVRGPIGGMAWHHLQYALGFHRLGHDVLFVEDSGDHPECYDPSRHVVDADPTYGLAFAADAFGSIGLGDRWAYFDAHTDRWLGAAADRAAAFIASADAVVNVSLVNPLRGPLAEPPVRIAIDTDPLFTQIRNVQEPDRLALTLAHNRFFSFGELIPTGRSGVPDDGVPWLATRQPIVLDCWPLTPPPPDAPLTTVMQWDSYRTVRFGGAEYGMKSVSFRPFMDLPGRVAVPLELAIGSAAAPRDELSRRGWRLRDPLEVTRTPDSYRRYIQQSRGEFSVAKHGYVAARTGWFSERSAAYLASGRPVIVEDTGFSALLPCGEGVHAFHDAESAAAAIESVSSTSTLECNRARMIADEFFRSDRVLAALLEWRTHTNTRLPETRV